MNSNQENRGFSGFLPTAGKHRMQRLIIPVRGSQKGELTGPAVTNFADEKENPAASWVFLVAGHES